MEIKEFADKYKLNPNDYWQHNQSKKWIVKHDALTKVATIENIKLTKIDPIYQSETSCRFLITMGKWIDDQCVDIVTTSGEADGKNCKMAYISCMAEKRGRDRSILKLLNAYEYGIYSDSETFVDDFDSKKDKNATQNQKNFIYNLLAKKQISSADYDFTNLSGKLAGDLINELNLKRGQYNKDVVLVLLKDLHRLTKEK